MKQHTDHTQTMTSADQVATQPEPREWLALEQAAERADHQTFALLTRAIDWSAHRPSELMRAIDLALTLDMVPLARELAQQGTKLFPEDTRVQQATAVLSPPVAIATRLGPGRHLEVSQTWLKDHASRYKGQWIAVCDGTLLGAAPTLKELYNQLGPEGKMAHTVLVKVLP